MQELSIVLALESAVVGSEFSTFFFLWLGIDRFIVVRNMLYFTKTQMESVLKKSKHPFIQSSLTVRLLKFFFHTGYLYPFL